MPGCRAATRVEAERSRNHAERDEAAMRLGRLVAAAASAAVSIGIVLHLRKRLRRSALENSVEAAPKHGVQRLGRKAMLANRATKQMNERARRRSRQSTNEGFLAFVSHMKAEAAMEARFLQTELESRHEDEVVFLDSDDLKDLRRLGQHVEESDALVLLQSAEVLLRPWCLFELCTAINSGVPIVAVAVASKGYDFADAGRLMLHLDSLLEGRNPGASKVLTAQVGITCCCNCSRTLDGTF